MNLSVQPFSEQNPFSYSLVGDDGKKNKNLASHILGGFDHSSPEGVTQSRGKGSPGCGAGSRGTTGLGARLGAWWPCKQQCMGVPALALAPWPRQPWASRQFWGVAPPLTASP